MKVIDRVKSFLVDVDPCRIAIIGYTQAGKSTYIKQLQENRILSPQRDVTIGMKDQEIVIDIDGRKYTFIASDFGGDEIRQRLEWNSAVAKSDGIVYVIDSSLMYNCEFVKKHDITTYQSYNAIVDQCNKKENYKGLSVCGCAINNEFIKSRSAKHVAFKILEKKHPRLILFNKVDLTESQTIHTPDELTKLYALTPEKNNENIMVSSALVGTNIREGTIWLLLQIEPELKTRISDGKH